jgi:hypothetical protein
MTAAFVPVLCMMVRTLPASMLAQHCFGYGRWSLVFGTAVTAFQCVRKGSQRVTAALLPAHA